jgi:hypothetical protein
LWFLLGLSFDKVNEYMAAAKLLIETTH